MVLGGSGHSEFAPQRSRVRVLSFLRAISDATADTSTADPASLAEAIARLQRVSRPGGLVFLISDFDDLDDEAERQLARLARRCDVGTVFVYDRLEAAAPVPGRYSISDGERLLSVDAGDRQWRAEYRARFDARRARLEDLCRYHRMAFFALETGHECSDILRGDRYVRAFHGRGRRQLA
jgi:uncharacterized protein (DUF58 family)